MPKVIIWRDGAIEIEFDPGHRDWRIGRSDTNDITLLDPRKSVSRFQAELREENGRWVFIDLNSQNGSWKEGQRVNRLVLEHGHEVLFGDYRLNFEDAKIVVPPPVPTEADVTADARAATAAAPMAAERTVLTTARTQEPSPAPAAPAPVASLPVARTPARADSPRKGVNPIILVLFLVAMLGAVAAVAWRMVSPRTVEPRVVQNADPVAPEPAPEPEPEPAPPPPAPEQTPHDAAVAATSEPAPAPAAITPAVTPPPPAPVPTTTPGPPVTAPGPVPPVPRAGPGATTTARPKRTPPPVPKDSPAVVTRYDAGRRALGAGRFAEAERAFQAVLSQQPNFRDAAALLEQARQGQVAAREKLLAGARDLEASGDWARAIAAYERAGAADQAAEARTKMAAAGDDAYRKARQFDARNRAGEAITWYQRAVEWLPDSDARRATAQERLALLKGGGA